ncbi:MAG: DUF1906 domain-containing protein [Actinomycetia bacterium]|nr:DUF1906 domain-containing protein [Actinomycetes bacterium]
MTVKIRASSANRTTDTNSQRTPCVADTTTALKLHADAGVPDLAPIFFSVDEDTDYDTWKTTALQWLPGINAVLGSPGSPQVAYSGSRARPQ